MNKSVFIGAALSLCAVTLSSVEANPQRDYWPTKAWRVATPASQGLSKKQLDKVRQFAENDGGSKALIIIRGGYIVGEWYFHGTKASDTHKSASVAKSFTSAVVGRAVTEGKIKGPKQSVADFSGGKFKAVTIEDLLTMSSGIQWAQSFDVDLRRAGRAGSYLDFIKQQKLGKKPGAKFQYKSCDPTLLSCIVKEATGKSMLDYGMATIFRPIGLTRLSWRADSTGVTNGAAGVETTARNYARFGYLFLNEGQWDGQKILAKKWVQRSTVFSKGPNKNYGYLWWHRNYKAPIPKGCYAAKGRGVQRVIVMPKLDMVVVRLGTDPTMNKARWENELLLRVVQSVNGTPTKKPAKGRKKGRRKPIK